MRWLSAAKSRFARSSCSFGQTNITRPSRMSYEKLVFPMWAAWRGKGERADSWRNVGSIQKGSFNLAPNISTYKEDWFYHIWPNDIIEHIEHVGPLALAWPISHTPHLVLPLPFPVLHYRRYDLHPAGQLWHSSSMCCGQLWPMQISPTDVRGHGQIGEDLGLHCGRCQFQRFAGIRKWQGWLRRLSSKCDPAGRFPTGHLRIGCIVDMRERNAAHCSGKLPKDLVATN